MKATTAIGWLTSALTRRFRIPWLASGSAFAGAVLSLSCSDSSTTPSGPGPEFAVSGQSSCPIPASIVVTDEAGLVAALAAASPGQVIGVSGTIHIRADLIISTPNVTLTCGSPGAGIAADTGGVVSFLVFAHANGVAVAYLTLDARNTIEGPYDADDASSLGLTHNSVICGPDVCAFFDENTPNAVVADNQFVSNGSFTGVQMQTGIDGSRVERNSIIATAPSTGFNFGAIRARDGSGVTIANNVIVGPWSNSLALADLSDSRVAQNRLQGAVNFGIRARAGGSFLPISITGDLFTGNIVTGAGAAGMLLRSACRNTFVGNDFQGNAGGLGAIFDITTGANQFDGNRNVVIDTGNFDCDGDGQPDRNLISGPGLVLHAPQGPPPPDSSAARQAKLR